MELFLKTASAKPFRYRSLSSENVMVKKKETMVKAKTNSQQLVSKYLHIYRVKTSDNVLNMTGNERRNL